MSPWILAVIIVSRMFSVGLHGVATVGSGDDLMVCSLLAAFSSSGSVLMMHGFVGPAALSVTGGEFAVGLLKKKKIQLAVEAVSVLRYFVLILD